jgi:hypothetical protein
MFTYIARPRALYPEPLGAKPQFPCAADVIFTFEPGSAFGVEGPVSKTVPVGVKMQMGWSVARGRLLM